MELYEYFKLFHDISIADYNLLTEKFKTKIFKKGDFITVPVKAYLEHNINLNLIKDKYLPPLTNGFFWILCNFH